MQDKKKLVKEKYENKYLGRIFLLNNDLSHIKKSGYFNIRQK